MPLQMLQTPLLPLLKPQRLLLKLRQLLQK
jgi:hypothetical protein